MSTTATKPLITIDKDKIKNASVLLGSLSAVGVIVGIIISVKKKIGFLKGTGVTLLCGVAGVGIGALVNTGKKYYSEKTITSNLSADPLLTGKATEDSMGNIYDKTGKFLGNVDDDDFYFNKYLDSPEYIEINGGSAYEEHPSV